MYIISGVQVQTYFTDGDSGKNSLVSTTEDHVQDVNDQQSPISLRIANYTEPQRKGDGQCKCCQILGSSEPQRHEAEAWNGAHSLVGKAWGKPWPGGKNGNHPGTAKCSSP